MKRRSALFVALMVAFSLLWIGVPQAYAAASVPACGNPCASMSNAHADAGTGVSSCDQGGKHAPKKMADMACAMACSVTCVSSPATPSPVSSLLTLPARSAHPALEFAPLTAFRPGPLYPPPRAIA